MSVSHNSFTEQIVVRPDKATSSVRLDQSLPLVTIITATFNAENELPRTIQSIRELRYENIEWLVIDGNSSDNTIKLIRDNADIIDEWISEPDSGIYDAWNKGVSKANGDWIAFLGAGDTYKPESISWYVDAILATDKILDFVSSRVEMVNSAGVVYREYGDSFNWEIVQKYMNIAHVGALHHRSLFDRYGFFDCTYRSSADYDFFMRCGERLKSLYLPVVTGSMLIGGVSDRYSGIYETYLIHRKYGAGRMEILRWWFACIKRFIRPLSRGY
jgi:glycosyltransferase involved in cell wall biosynthesis